MTYIQRLSFFIFIDSWLVLAAILVSSFLIKDELEIFSFSFTLSLIVILLVHHFLSFQFKLYKKVWAYASVGELISILKVETFTILFTVIIQQLVLDEVFIRYLIVTWMLNLLFVGSSRFCFRWFRDSVLNKTNNKKRTLIIGAGSAGVMVARQLKKTNEANLLPVGFIDDDEKKHKLDILGIPVLGGITKIEAIVKNFSIDHIVIAIPSLNRTELNKIFAECVKTSAKTQILPMLEDLVTGKVSVKQFRDVQVEDLLGREPVDLDIQSITAIVTNKVVLVTGAGGSIGSEICRQLAAFYPKQLILLGHGENSIYTIEMELKERYQQSPIEFISVIADVQDERKMMSVMSTYRPDVVYHAAAHKHVPLMEENPEEAIKNNLIGTINTAEAARWNGVKAFVMVSTDKAVNPTSVMGATKRLAEMVIQYLNTESETKFVTVRFGNVLGSRGSVIPLFKRQIEKGGPVTVTHPDMVRYFMTIPEASRLVLQASALANGGEIFILDMGQPVKILDLAKNLIKLSGFSLEEIEIEFTGIRPGEKLFEELLNENEVYQQQIYPNIYVGKPSDLFIQEIEELISHYSNLEKDEIRSRVIQLTNRKEVKTKLSVPI
ncbi:nucleoside-diphosphate sugar epimerase/dehydratase [Neobacillus sp. OS1-32]|uniref:polysaccharide biosynthesis protein n=1 Tax=Neobacillus sp. OS1-32 TaxID=3070682 RepID=UPI0027E0E7A1|nr:nucleoside-diphosphate sugar epimerase/dehydratase [Neobacillus sp. OS1-32]WML30296.1 nucleoside-diphosphate sugar epimerase/dehydratase [Neobacillus sp. OS1-32]